MSISEEALRNNRLSRASDAMLDEIMAKSLVGFGWSWKDKEVDGLDNPELAAGREEIIQRYVENITDGDDTENINRIVNDFSSITGSKPVRLSSLPPDVNVVNILKDRVEPECRSALKEFDALKEFGNVRPFDFKDEDIEVYPSILFLQKDYEPFSRNVELDVRIFLLAYKRAPDNIQECLVAWLALVLKKGTKPDLIGLLVNTYVDNHSLLAMPGSKFILLLRRIRATGAWSMGKDMLETVTTAIRLNLRYAGDKRFHEEAYRFYSSNLSSRRSDTTLAECVREEMIEIERWIRFIRDEAATLIQRFYKKWYYSPDSGKGMLRAKSSFQANAGRMGSELLNGQETVENASSTTLNFLCTATEGLLNRSASQELVVVLEHDATCSTELTGGTGQGGAALSGKTRMGEKLQAN